LLSPDTDELKIKEHPLKGIYVHGLSKTVNNNFILKSSLSLLLIDTFSLKI